MPQRLCICQICRCGRHRCPHNHSNNDESAEFDNKPCAISEYHANFRGEKGAEARVIRPTDALYLSLLQTHEDERFKSRELSPNRQSSVKQRQLNQSQRTEDDLSETSDVTNEDLPTNGGISALSSSRRNKKSRVKNRSSRGPIDLEYSKSGSPKSGRKIHPKVPLRVLRELRGNIVFGEDSAKYDSTFHEAFKQYSPGAGRQPKADKANQLTDQILLGTATPRLLLSTTQDVYRKFDLAAREPRKKDALNDSGLVLGDDELDYLTWNRKDYKKYDGAARELAKNRGFFDGTSGLVFGDPANISARFLTTSNSAFKPMQTESYNNDAAKRNKQHLMDSEGLFSTDYQYPDDRLQNEKDRYEKRKMETWKYEKPERVKRDLFKPTEGFTESNFLANSARQSDVKSKDKRVRSRAGKWVLTQDEEAREDQESQRSGKWFQDEERYSNRTKGRRRKKRKFKSNRTVLQSVGNDERQDDLQQLRTHPKKITFLQLEEDVRSIRNAKLQPNGMLWFGVDDAAEDQQLETEAESLPKWASTALNLPVPKPRSKKNTKQDWDVDEKQDERVDTVTDNYMRLDQKGSGGRMEKSIVSSDEGLVLEENEPILSPAGFNHNNLDSGRFNSVDSLEATARSVEGIEEDVVQEIARNNAVNLKTAGMAARSSAILSDILASNRKEDLKIARLVPLHAKSTPESATVQTQQKSETAQEASGNPRTIVDTTATSHQKEVERTASSPRDIMPDHSGTKQIETETLLGKTYVIKPSNQPEPASKEEMVLASKNDSPNGSHSSSTKKTLRSTSLTKTTSGLRETVVKNEITSVSISSRQTKGRRRLGRETQRDQNPRATSLGRILNEGHNEVSTTSKEAFQSRSMSANKGSSRKYANAAGKPSDVAKLPEIFPATNHPVRHSPRASSRTAVPEKKTSSGSEKTVIMEIAERMEVPRIGEGMQKLGAVAAAERGYLSGKSTKESTIFNSKELQSDLRSPRNQPAKGKSSSQRRSASSPRNLPANFERVKAIKQSDNRIFDSVIPFAFYSSSSRNEPRFPTVAAPRIHSLDRKQTRSQIADIFQSPQDEISPRSTRNLAKQIDSAKLQGERAAPFLPRNHIIFERFENFLPLPEKKEVYKSFTGDTRAQPIRPKEQLDLFSKDHSQEQLGLPLPEKKDVYRNFPAAVRSQPIRPKQQLQLFSKDDSSIPTPVTRDAYKAFTTGSRSPSAKPKEQLGWLLKEGGGSARSRSVTHDAYKNYEGVSRPQPVKSGATINLSQSLSREPFPTLTTSKATFNQKGAPSPPRLIRPHSSAGLWSSSVPNSSRYSRRTSQDTSLPPISGKSGASSMNHSLYGVFPLPERRALMRQGSSGALNYPDAKLSDITTNKEAFKQFPAGSGRREPVRPSPMGVFTVASNESVSKMTTSKEAYKGAQVPPRSKSQPPKAALPDILGQKNGRMSPTTTSKSTFKSYEVEKVSRASRPRRLAQLNPVTGEVKIFEPRATKDGVVLVPASEEICPAALVMEGKVDWKYLGKQEGHLYYDVNNP